MSNINLINLPNEILEDIFENLHLKDLKNVTLVCKQLNKVIGNSNTLMNKMKLRIDEYEDYTELDRSKRKYQSINIQLNDSSEILRSFLQKQSSLTKMRLFGCCLKASEFYWLMKCVNETIVDLNFNKTTIISDWNITPLQFQKLERLGLLLRIYEYGFDFLINYFYGARNVKAFDCYFYGTMNLEELKLFWRFIESMSSLKYLNSSGCLFHSDNFLSTQLNLEKLAISFFFFENPSIEIMTNIAKFLDTQRFSMKVLDLNHVNITSQLLQSILSMKELKQLKLNRPKFFASTFQNEISYSMNNSIEEIDLSHNESDVSDEMIQNFLMKCIGLKKLDLCCVEISFNMLYTLTHHVESLESLSLRRCTFYAMSMLKIKEMTLISKTGDDENVIRMILLNRQLKKLKMPEYLQYNQRCISAIQEINVEVEFLPLVDSETVSNPSSGSDSE